MRGLGHTLWEHAERAEKAQIVLNDAARAATALARTGHCEQAIKRLVDAARAQGVYVAHQAQTGDVVNASSLELDRAVHAVTVCAGPKR